MLEDKVQEVLDRLGEDPRLTQEIKVSVQRFLHSPYRDEIDQNALFYTKIGGLAFAAKIGIYAITRNHLLGNFPYGNALTAMLIARDALAYRKNDNHEMYEHHVMMPLLSLFTGSAGYYTASLHKLGADNIYASRILRYAQDRLREETVDHESYHPLHIWRRLRLHFAPQVDDLSYHIFEREQTTTEKALYYILREKEVPLHTLERVAQKNVSVTYGIPIVFK